MKFCLSWHCARDRRIEGAWDLRVLSSDIDAASKNTEKRATISRELEIILTWLYVIMTALSVLYLSLSRKKLSNMRIFLFTFQSSLSKSKQNSIPAWKQELIQLRRKIRNIWDSTHTLGDIMRGLSLEISCRSSERSWTINSSMMLD